MSDPIETAWRVHAAQVDWTGKVDAKATFAFGIESAALGLAVTLSSGGRTFDGLQGIPTVLYLSGVIILLAGALVALLAVIPRLRSSKTRNEAYKGYIYFGHLRHWSADGLAAHLLKEADLLSVLTRQCVSMADIAWHKHRLVQISFVLGAMGIALLAFCGAWNALF
jgi:hypothetical protein